jgi:hypothetical protein
VAGEGSSRGQNKAQNHDGDKEREIGTVKSSEEMAKPNNLTILRLSEPTTENKSQHGKAVLHAVVPKWSRLAKRIINPRMSLAKSTV